MRTTIAIATFLTIGAGAVGASALNIKGSDTLYNLTQAIITSCQQTDGLPAGSIVYDGTGSGNGESGMKSGTQQVAPMSRAVKGATSGAGCTVSGTAGSPTTVEGLVLGLDGIAIIGATTTAGSAACNGAADPDCNGSPSNVGLAYSTPVAGTTYTLSNWKDVLRIVYAGVDMAAGSSMTTRDCNSTLRRAVVNSWGNMFQNACSSSSCTQLRHAFRRDDASGTTDTLVTLLGLASIVSTGSSPSTPFCNALKPTDTAPTLGRFYPDYQDNDVIRRACLGSNNGTTPSTSPHEQVCSRNGDLGLVLTIPPVDTLPQGTLAGQAYAAQPCKTGVFMFGTAPETASGSGRCPNGDVIVFGNQCLVPVDASGNAGCLAGAGTYLSFAFDQTTVIDGMTATDPNQDGRMWNQHLYAADGTYQYDVKGRQIQGAFHRLHTTRTALNPSNGFGCTHADATSQIGCLVKASPCSIGFAGREAAVMDGVAGLKLNAIEPSSQCILNFMDSTKVAQTYPLTRKLYLNTMKGFESVTGNELTLAKCFNNKAPGLMSTYGFFPLTGNTTRCEDFNEQTECGASGNVNACANNVSPFPTN
jgi:hypothetical protein